LVIGNWEWRGVRGEASRLERLGAKEGQFTGARAFLAVKCLDRDLRNEDGEVGGNEKVRNSKYKMGRGAGNLGARRVSGLERCQKKSRRTWVTCASGGRFGLSPSAVPSNFDSCCEKPCSQAGMGYTGQNPNGRVRLMSSISETKREVAQ
jgi:hypothetical protein